MNIEEQTRLIQIGRDEALNYFKRMLRDNIAALTYQSARGCNSVYTRQKFATQALGIQIVLQKLEESLVF